MEFAPARPYGGEWTTFYRLESAGVMQYVTSTGNTYVELYAGSTEQAQMTEPSYFRLPTEGADQPIMLWPKDGDFIVQIGSERPWLNHKDPSRFAMIVTDMLWMCKPVTKAEWNWAMENGTWPTQ